MASQVATKTRANTTQPQRPLSWGREVTKRFLRQFVAVVAGLVLLLIVLVAIFAPYVAPYDPTEQFRKDGLSDIGLPLPPNAKFLLGTDSVGRDLLSRTIFGARVSLSIGVAATLLANIVALIVGGIAGFMGGRTDTFIMRFVDMVMSVPTFFITLLLIVLVGPNPWILILVIALFGWTYGSRVYRAEVRSLKARTYVEAAYSLGGSDIHIFFKHILPHLLPLVLTYVTLGIPSAIFAEAGLSFLGLGVQPPTASWGSMIFIGMQSLRQTPWVTMIPVLALMITVLALNLFGSGLRDALDPLRKGR
jgi:peptide/nickel transport system permease protein